MGKPRSPKGRAVRTNELLALEYPGAECELDHDSAFQLLIATILSAQATDVGVNKATPGLFEKYPDAESLANAKGSEVEKLIGSIGLFRTKSANIIRCSQKIISDFGGEVPTSIKDLTSLAGVGRKTANVVRSVALDLPGLPVDTHVKRLSNLLGLTDKSKPEHIEAELNEFLDPDEWGEFSLRMILHGRRVCVARRPNCADCVLNNFCPSTQI